MKDGWKKTLFVVLALVITVISAMPAKKPPPKASAYVSGYTSGYTSGAKPPKPKPKPSGGKGGANSFIQAVVQLTGVTKEQFGKAEQSNFKAVIAAAMPKGSCSRRTYTRSSTCTKEDVTITTISNVETRKRAAKKLVEVGFKVSIEKKNAGKTTKTLTSFLQGDSFANALRAKGGNLAKVTSTKVVSAPRACHPSKGGSNTCTDEDVAKLAAGIIALIVILIVLFCVCPCICVILICCCGFTIMGIGMSQKEPAPPGPGFQMSGIPEASPTASAVPGSSAPPPQPWRLPVH